MQPLTLLASMATEIEFKCAAVCENYPSRSQSFVAATEVLSTVLSLPLALPLRSGPGSPLRSCRKMDVFFLVALAFLLPACLLYVLERDSRDAYMRAAHPRQPRRRRWSWRCRDAERQEERRSAAWVLLFATAASWQAIDMLL
jgi:hypothetical protein